jgi:hypothetical protein
MTYSTIRFEQVSGRKSQDLVIKGGTLSMVNAGLQREREDRYRWDGNAYTLFSSAYDPSNYLYYKVVDADMAMNKRDYYGAIKLYKQALTDDSLKTWKEGKAKEERTGLRAFAAYRLYICYRFKGDTTSAEAVLNDLKQNYASTGYVALTELFAKTYKNQAQLASVSEQIGAYVYKHPELLEPVNGFGYANPGYTPDDFCPYNWALDGTP